MRFLGTKEAGRIALIGFPLDETVSYRPGTRFAPVEIRKASEAIETYSPYLDADLEEKEIADLGDFELPIGNRERCLELIKKKTEEILERFEKILILGGEHLLSLAAAKAVSSRFPDMVFIHIDAHTDARSEYLGEKLSHACVLRRIKEDLGIEIIQIGARSGLRSEFEFLNENCFFFSPFRLERPEIPQGKPVYLSLDIDVLDPAFCPGVGTPEPGGVSTKEIIEFLKNLRGLNIVAADLVELCPPADPTDNSAVVAALLAREILLLLS